jgi:hypothetical protein
LINENAYFKALQNQLAVMTHAKEEHERKIADLTKDIDEISRKQFEEGLQIAVRIIPVHPYLFLNFRLG